MTFAAGSDDVHTSRALYIAFCSHTMHVMPASAIIPAPVPSAPPAAVRRCSSSAASSGFAGVAVINAWLPSGPGLQIQPDQHPLALRKVADDPPQGRRQSLD